MLQATVSSAEYPEYGAFSISFPIPGDEYEHILGLLGPVGMGDVILRDCYVEELNGNFPVLKGLEGSNVNLDELDYLAKRLDSFGPVEAAQFQAMAERLELCSAADLINLTFCCQRVTVITDFSDLEAVGRAHYMNLHDGCATAEELEALDGYETALSLIDSETGAVTPYGVVYDNGMKLEQVYDGRHFPAYLYDDALLELCITSKHRDPDHPAGDYLYLPAPDSVIQRTLFRSGLAPGDVQFQVESHTLPQAVADVLDINEEDIYELNEMCRAIRELGGGQTDKLSAAVLLAKPECAFEVGELAKNLDLFDFIPGVRDPEEYGRFMIRESGHFDYDPNLDGFYNYSQYGWDRINREQGQFNGLGYISYQGTLTLDELLCGDPAGQLDRQINEMRGMS